MQSSMLRHITEDLGNGGTIDGDVIITGDLQVNGGGSLSFDEVIEGTQVIDVTSTEALLVRKNSDGGDVFTVDTTNSIVSITGNTKIIKSGGTSLIVGSTDAGGASISLDGDSNGDGAGADYSYITHDTAGILNIVQDSPSGTNEIRFGTAGTEDKITIDANGNLIVGSDGNGADVTFYSATAGDSFVWDASAEKLTITGTNGQTALDVADGNLVVADNVDIEGDIDINGTTNLDAVDIDGNVQLDGTFTVGTDGSGQDVTFYSATSGDSFVWDASEEKLTITGTDSALALDIADGYVKVQESLSITNGAGSMYVWSDDPFGTNYEVLRIDKPSGANARLSVYKGGTGTARGLSIETGSAGEGIIIDSSSNVAIANNLDVDGTTNLDAVDIDGAVQIDSTLTVGVDDTGQDVKFFGATSGKYMLWDESEDNLIVSGAVGIGSTSPPALLTVADGVGTVPTLAAGDLAVFQNNNDTSDIAVVTIISGNAGSGYLVFGDAEDKNRGRIQYDHSSNSMKFTTDDSNKLIIDSSGNVGMNTTSPMATLHVKHTTDDTDENGNVAMTVGGDATGEVRHYWGVNNASNYAYYGAVEHATQYVPLVLQPNGSYVGIGVTDPDSELEIFHATDPQIKLSINTHGDAGIMLGDADGLKLFGKGASNQLRLYSGASTLQAQIDANGITFNDVVDITDTTDSSDDSGDTGALRVEGGASIAKKLYVGGATTVGENDATASSLGIGTDASITANTTKLQIGNHNTAVSAIYLTDNDAQDDWYIASNQSLAIGYNNSAKLSITQAGDVGINTTAPETKFTIDQTADDNGIRIYGYDDVSSRYGEIFIDSSGYLNIDASTDRGIEIKGHANDFWVNSGADLFVRMTYDSKLGVGTTTPSEVLTVSGNIDLKNSSGFAKIDNSGSLSMADDATTTISSSRNGSALILVYEVGSGIGALFFTCFGLAVTKLAGTSLTANSDSDGDLCCYNSGHTITVKNRLGATKTVVITVLGGNVY